MAKPVTKGAQIAVRLPIEVDTYIRERAAAHGETAAEYVTRQIVRTARKATGDPEFAKMQAPMSEFTGELAANVMKKVARGPIPITPSGPRPLPPPKGSCEHRSTRFDDAVGGRVCKHCGEILPT